MNNFLGNDIASALALLQPEWQRPGLWVSPDGVRATIIYFGTDARAWPPHTPAAATLKRGRWADDHQEDPEEPEQPEQPEQPPTLKRALQREPAPAAAPKPPTLHRPAASCARTTPPDGHLAVFAEVRKMFASAPSLRHDCFPKLNKSYHKHILLGMVPTLHLRKRLFATLTNPQHVPHLRAWAPHHLAAAVDQIAAFKNVCYFPHCLTVLQATFVFLVLHASQVIREHSPVARLMQLLLLPDGKASADVIHAWLAQEGKPKHELGCFANRCLVAPLSP